MPQVAFTASSSVSTTLKSLINDTTSGLPTQTADGWFLGATLRCSAATVAETFVVRMLGASSEVLWEDSRVGAWASPIVVPPMALPTTGWDLVAIKLAGADRTISGEGIYDTGTAAAPSAAAVAAAVWASVLEGAHTAGDLARLTVARLLGKATIQATDGAYTYRDLGDTKNRIVGSVSGTARTISTVDGT